MSLSRVISSSAIIATASFAMVAFASPASATQATYYPSGAQSNVAKSNVTNGGWTLCWSEAYGETADMPSVVAGTDNGSVAPCNGDELLLTGWKNNDAENLIALAVAPRADVFTETPYADGSGVPYARSADGWASHCIQPGSIHTTARLVNGAYWYYTPGCSMGFAPTSAIDTWPGDSCPMDSTQATRLSWHMYDSAHPESVNGGFSLGENCWLNGSSTFTRAIYTAASPNSGGSAQSGSGSGGSSAGTDSAPALATTGVSIADYFAASLMLLASGAAAVMVTRRRKRS